MHGRDFGGHLPRPRTRSRCARSDPNIATSACMPAGNLYLLLCWPGLFALCWTAYSIEVLAIKCMLAEDKVCHCGRVRASGALPQAPWGSLCAMPCQSLVWLVLAFTLATLLSPRLDEVLLHTLWCALGRTHARSHAHSHARSHAHSHACSHARSHARSHAQPHARSHACSHAHSHAHPHAHVAR